MKSEADKAHWNSQWTVNDKARLCNALITLQGKITFPGNFTNYKAS